MCVFILSLQTVQHFNKFTTIFKKMFKWTMIIQFQLSGFITYTFEIKQFLCLFSFTSFPFISSDDSDIASLFHRWKYVNSRDNPEHQYWQYQSRPIREKKSVSAELYYLYHKGSFHLIYVNITVVTNNTPYLFTTYFNKQ